MEVRSTREATRRFTRQLAEWLSTGSEELILRHEVVVGDVRLDFVVESPLVDFLVEFKRTNTLSSVEGAAEMVQMARRKHGGQVVPVVLVPYMTDGGRELCEERNVSWADLSGNAHISAPNLLIHVEGKPNKFKKRGRRSKIFTGKGARIARYLLMHPNESFTQKELTEATDISKGHTSRVVKGLEEERLIDRVREGRSAQISVRDPDLLLDSWREKYDFESHSIHRGIVGGRSGISRLKRMAEKLEEVGTPYAATGLAGAWLWDEFANFRTATVYLKHGLTEEVREALDFREDPQGANVWLVSPQDEGVFQGQSKPQGINSVHPVQIYLDLKAHPERASEAAENLRRNQLEWSNDGGA